MATGRDAKLRTRRSPLAEHHRIDRRPPSAAKLRSGNSATAPLGCADVQFTNSRRHLVGTAALFETAASRPVLRNACFETDTYRVAELAAPGGRHRSNLASRRRDWVARAKRSFTRRVSAAFRVGPAQTSANPDSTRARTTAREDSTTVAHLNTTPLITQRASRRCRGGTRANARRGAHVLDARFRQGAQQFRRFACAEHAVCHEHVKHEHARRRPDVVYVKTQVE